MANIAFGQVSQDKQGCAYSPEFGDIYSTRDGAYEQSRFVFLAGNGLPERWRGKDQFVILENGFGLGTNFLTTLKEFRNDKQRCRKLHFVSVEGFPLAPDELIRFAAPELKAEAIELAQKWPDRTPGIHQITFDKDSVVLTLYFMDAKTAAKKMMCRFDAFFPDGFAPSKNPQMWEPCVLKGLTSCAREGATLATWCVASKVRQAFRDAGFRVDKVPGFGHKLQMLQGCYLPAFKHRRKKTVYLPPTSVPKSAIVIGAGLAGSSCAKALSEKGVKVIAIDSGPVAATGASALRWGVVHSQPSADDNYLFRLSRAGFFSLKRDIDAYPELCCLEGMFQMARSEEEQEKWRNWIKEKRPFNFPDDFLRVISSEEIQKLTGAATSRGGFWHGGAGIIAVSRLVQRRLSDSGATQIYGARVDAIRKEDGHWHALDVFGNKIASADALILCAAGDSLRLAGLSDSTTIWKGRISLLNESSLKGYVGALTGPGYLIQAPDSWTGIGATYESYGDSLSREEAQQNNISHLSDFFPTGYFLSPVIGFYEGYRCVTKDRLPLIGTVQNSRFHPDCEGLYMSSAMGSRGTVFSGLAARIIVAEMFSEPLPVESDLLHAVDPSRFEVGEKEKIKK